jgi:hypothetical protein
VIEQPACAFCDRIVRISGHYAIHGLFEYRLKAVLDIRFDLQVIRRIVRPPHCSFVVCSWLRWSIRLSGLFAGGFDSFYIVCGFLMSRPWLRVLRYGPQVKIGVDNIVRHANLAVRRTYHQAVLDQHAHVFMHSFHIAVQLPRYQFKLHVVGVPARVRGHKKALFRGHRPRHLPAPYDL